MKKIRVLVTVLFSAILLSTNFTGCKNGASDTTDVPEEQADTTVVDNATSFQGQIDNATAGSTVTLNASLTGAGSSISINKALTVNGNNIEGLTVTVSSAVSSGVTLKNFKNATIRVATPSAGRSARSARAADVDPDPTVIQSPVDDEEISFKKFGDEALPLFLEGCTIEKFEAEKDVTLYLGIEDKKSVIDELCLKDGVEEFTFVEFDKADKPETTTDEKTDKEDKTWVKKLSIEDDGIKEINLIGGTFSDVDYADDFAGSVDFKYDKEFEADQFDFGTGADATAKKDAFMDKFEPEDIGVAEKTDSVKEYSFPFPKDSYSSFDGRYAVIFMTDEQKACYEAGNFTNIQNTISATNPIYAAFPTGAFKIDYNSNSGTLKTIYGSESAYLNYANAISRGLTYCEALDVVILEKYRNYNKEAFIAEIGTDNITIYVNMANVRKEDVLMCSYNGSEQFGEVGTKLTDINLDGYKPYIYLNWDKYQLDFYNTHVYPVLTAFDGDEDAYRAALEAYGNEESAGRSFAMATALMQTTTYPGEGGVEMTATNAVMTWIPYGDSIKMRWEFQGTITPMNATTYPEVGNIEYSKIGISDDDRAWAQELVRMFSEE